MLIGPVWFPSISRIRPSTFFFFKRNSIMWWKEDISVMYFLLESENVSSPCRKHNKNSLFEFREVERSKARHCKERCKESKSAAESELKGIKKEVIFRSYAYSGEWKKNITELLELRSCWQRDHHQYSCGVHKYWRSLQFLFLSNHFIMNTIWDVKLDYVKNCAVYKTENVTNSMLPVIIKHQSLCYSFPLVITTPDSYNCTHQTWTQSLQTNPVLSNHSDDLLIPRYIIQ